VDRVRKHVAGDGGAGAGIAACAGPAAHASEEPAEFAARQASFVAARVACRAKVAELRHAIASARWTSSRRRTRLCRTARRSGR
jgi:hypothetical protein